MVSRGTAILAAISGTMKKTGMTIEGIPVVLALGLESVSVIAKRERRWWPWAFERHPGVCELRGMGPWKRVFLGDLSLQLPMRFLRAMIMHEIGHAKHLHNEKRLLALWQIVLAPAAFMRCCIAQEFEADRYAALHGYGSDLAAFLSFVNSPKGALHPSSEERIARLLAPPVSS